MAEQDMHGDGQSDGGEASGGHDWRRLHLWQLQPVRDVLLLAAIFGLLYLGSVLSLLTVPLLLAMLLAYLFEPVVRRMTRLSWVSRQGSAVVIIVAIALLVLLPVSVGVGYAVTDGYRVAQSIANKVVTVYRVREAVAGGDDERAAEFVESLRVQPEPDEAGDASGEPPPPVESKESKDTFWSKFAEHVREASQRRREQQRGPPPDATSTNGSLQSLTQDPLVALIDEAYLWVEENSPTIRKGAIVGGLGIAGYLARGARTVVSVGFGAFLTGFFFFFICTGWGKVLQFWRSLIPERKQGDVIELVKKMDAVVAGFIRGRLTIMLIQIAFFSVGFTLVGVPAGLLLGAMVGVLALVPYLALVGVPAAIILMALDQPTGFRGSIWWILIAPTVVYQLGQLMDDYVLTPRIQGKETDMDTPTVLFASIAGGILAGFYGLLVAIPVAACVKILLREVVWPKFDAWARGEANDPLPLGRSNSADE